AGAAGEEGADLLQAAVGRAAPEGEHGVLALGGVVGLDVDGGDGRAGPGQGRGEAAGQGRRRGHGAGFPRFEAEAGDEGTVLPVQRDAPGLEWGAVRLGGGSPQPMAAVCRLPRRFPYTSQGEITDFPKSVGPVAHGCKEWPPASDSPGSPW